MAKYLILFNAPEPMSKFMARNTPEQRQAGLDAWNRWRDKAEKTVTFQFGSVLEAVNRIDASGCSNSSPIDASNYAFVESDTREAVTEALKSHPHLSRDGASIDVLEVLAMPE